MEYYERGNGQNMAHESPKSLEKGFYLYMLII